MRSARRGLSRAIAAALVAAAGLAAGVAFDGTMSSAAAQPCGYPPFPPCRPMYVPPPPPPPMPYYQPRQVVIGYTCKVPGPNCELYNGRPVGSTCWCRGRKGYVAY